MKTIWILGAALLAPVAANAQTVINNNNVIINNQNGGGDNRRGDYSEAQSWNWRNDSLKLDAWLYTDRTNYRAGTGVQLRLTLTNFGNGNATYALPRNGEYSITITDTRTNRVVWSRNRAQNRGAVLRLNSGGTAQYLEVWDQRDAAGNIVPLGAYRVDVRALDVMPLSATIFLTDKNVSRPQPGDNGNGDGIGGGGWGRRNRFAQPASGCRGANRQWRQFHSGVAGYRYADTFANHGKTGRCRALLLRRDEPEPLVGDAPIRLGANI